MSPYTQAKTRSPHHFLGKLVGLNQLHFRNGDKMATNLTLMQQFLTLFNHILAK